MNTTRALVLLVCWLGAGLSGCSSRCPVLVLQVDELPAGATALEAHVTAAGTAAQAPLRFSGELRRIGIEVPQGVKGPLRVTLSALSSAGCELGVAQGEYALGAEQCWSEGALVMQPQRRQVTLQLSGAPVDARALRLVTSAPGQRASAVQERALPQQELSLLLLPGAAGPQTVYAEAVSGDGESSDCVAARGEVLVPLSSCQPVTASLSLKELAPDQRLCRCAEELCWEDPVTPRNNLYGAFALGEALYAVGAQGVILRRSADSWIHETSGTTRDLYTIWGTAADDLWAAGSGVVLHRTTQGWQTVPVRPGTWYGLSGLSSGALWLVGTAEEVDGRRYGVILHRGAGASGWLAEVKEYTDQELFTVWAGASGVWAAGGRYAKAGLYPAQSGAASRLVLRREATGSWTEVKIPVGEALPIRQVLGVEDEVWLVGGFYRNAYGGDPRSSVLRLRQGAWTDLSAQAGSAPLNSIWGTKPDRLFLVGGSLFSGTSAALRWNGVKFEAVLTQGSALLRGVAGTAQQVFAVGDADTRQRLDPQPEGAPDVHQIGSLWAVAPDDVWAVGTLTRGGAVTGVMRHWDGQRWEDRTPRPAPPALWSVWAAGPADVWFSGSRGTLLHQTPEGLAQDSGARALIGTASDLQAVWGIGADVWVAGGGLNPGQRGVVVRRRGGQWEDHLGRLPVAMPQLRDTLTFYAVWGSDPEDVWLGGGLREKEGFIYHYKNNTWIDAVAPGREWVLGLWGSGADHAWSVAGGVNQPRSLVARLQGSTWTEVSDQVEATQSAVVRTDRFRGVWGSGPADVWLTGGTVVNNRLQAGEAAGYARRWDGQTVSKVALPLSANLDAVTGVGPHHVWLAGHNGAVLRKRLPKPR